ncbi:MAG: hypothetical protein WD872_13420, partial [Pirellulaceae bacterium]
GMGGGGGGGFFAVEDDLSLGAKSQPAAAPAAASQSQVRRPAAKAQPKAAIERIAVPVSADQTVAQAWEKYFSEQEAMLAARQDSAAAIQHLLARVRETVRQLMHEKKYSEVPVMVQAALRHGVIEAWMYEAMGLAIRADVNAAPEDLERALLSAVDFATTDEEVLFIATYMADLGLHERALSLCRQLAKADPDRPEPYVQGLALAKRLGDIEGIQWSTAGILRQSWSDEDRSLAGQAYRIAKTTYEQLLAEDKTAEAQAFDKAIRAAQERDLVVVVSWTGDADVDISMEEPAGTICSERQPRSTAGGVHMGDLALGAGAGAAGAKGLSEAYVCGKAFAGDYRLILKNIWGRPTSGKVTVDVYTHYGTDKQEMFREQIEMKENIAAVDFKVHEGRRKDALPEVQVANVVKVQNAVNRAVLAQQLAAMDDSEAARDFAASLALARRSGLGRPFFRRGAVGYSVTPTIIPEGASMAAVAVISADRRYVRITPEPFFSQITEVSTFNIVTGGSTTQGQGGAGGGTGFGGAGGGGGGGFL